MRLQAEYPDAGRPIESQDDLILLTMLLWGESRGEDTIGKMCVGSVVRNRVNNPGWWGKNWRSVILKPYQFSCFNLREDPNRKKLLVPLTFGTPREWQDCFYVAVGIYGGHIQDCVRGGNHYFDRSIPEPSWAQGKTPCMTWGKLKFYRL